MEEDVGPGSRVGVSKLPLSGELHSELLFERMGGEGQVEGSYEEGDEGEIMVEVVGSDVFVNGVSGHNGDLDGHEWGNREENGSKKFSEVMEVWNEGDVLDEEVWNPEIDAMVVASSKVIESVPERTIEVMETTTVVISEKKVVKCEAVDRDTENFVKAELSERPSEAVVEGKIQTSEKEERLPSSGYDGDHDHLGEDSVMIHEATNASDGLQTVPSEIPLVPSAEVQDNAQVSGSKDEVFKAQAELTSSYSDSSIDSKIVDETEVFAAESKDPIVNMDAIVSNVQNENQGVLEEFRGTKFGLPHGSDDASCASPGSQPDGDGTAELSKPKVVNIEIQAGTEENLPNKMASSSPGDTVIAKVDSGIHVNEPPIATSIEEMIDPKVLVSQVKVVDVDGSSDKEEIDSKVLAQSLERSGNADLSIPSDEVNKSAEAEDNLRTPKEAYTKIGTQIIENTGIREESSWRCGVNHSSGATTFEPDKLLEYISNLAPCASSSADRLDFVIAQAQFSAFCHFKGCRSSSKFPSSGELIENDLATEQVNSEMVVPCKRRCTPMDGSHSCKDRSLTELMGDKEYSPDAEDDLGKSVSLSYERKRKALDPLANGSDKRVGTNAAKLSTLTTCTPKPSFKIGQCISRVASQLTGSTPLVKGNNDEIVIDGFSKICKHSEKQSVAVSAESFTVNEMLLQLQSVAQDPKKRQNIRSSIQTFFWGFRSSIVLNKRDRKIKAEPTISGSSEGFEFDDANDSSLKDRIVRNHSVEQLRIVQNYSAEQLRHEWENQTANLQRVPFRAEKSVKTGHTSHSRKRFSTGNYLTAVVEPDDVGKRQKQESSPAELILNFAERKCVPSEINLNKMFRRFGPLMESETEADHDSGRAKVIFKRGSDAQVALSSAKKFNIFGPVLVKYQIGYSPLISVKILPLAIPQCPEGVHLPLQYSNVDSISQNGSQNDML